MRTSDLPSTCSWMPLPWVLTTTCHWVLRSFREEKDSNCLKRNFVFLMQFIFFSSGIILILISCTSGSFVLLELFYRNQALNCIFRLSRHLGLWRSLQNHHHAVTMTDCRATSDRRIDVLFSWLSIKRNLFMSSLDYRFLSNGSRWTSLALLFSWRCQGQ